MMRRFAVFILIAIVALSAVGCAAKAKQASVQAPAVGSSSTPKTTNTPKGFTVNKISFTEITQENASEEIKQFIERNKANRGYHFFTGESGEITLIVFAGEKNTGGYSIKVQSIEDNEGKAVVVVNETVPPKEAVVTMQITYPVSIVKFKGTTTNFAISDTKGEEFKPVKLVDSIQQSQSGTSSEKKTAIRGKITKLIPLSDMSGFNFMVEGKLEADTCYDKASVTVKSNTKVYSGNEKLSVKDLKEGMVIEIQYDGPVRESYPPQMGADIIKIIQ